MAGFALIEIRGGVADITDWTDGTAVVIVDWDDIGDVDPDVSAGYRAELRESLDQYAGSGATVNGRVAQIRDELADSDA